MAKHNFGKERAKKTKGKTYVELYGKKKAKQIREMISKKLIARQTGKTWEELWGKDIANKIKEQRKRRMIGKKSYMLGKRHNKKTKERMKKSHQGSKNASWKGGISREPYVYNFKGISKRIRKRDNYICQLCGEKIISPTKRKFLTAHHIDYNKKNNEDLNLITLCNFCNSSVNTLREQWTQIFQNKMGNILNGI